MKSELWEDVRSERAILDINFASGQDTLGRNIAGLLWRRDQLITLAAIVVEVGKLTGDDLDEFVRGLGEGMEDYRIR